MAGHAAYFKCSFEGCVVKAEFDSLEELKSHILHEHYGIVWRCECGLLFEGKQALDKHIEDNQESAQTIHLGNLKKLIHPFSDNALPNNSETGVMCVNCNKTFISRAFYDSHANSKCQMLAYDMIIKYIESKLAEYEPPRKQPRTSKHNI